MLICSVFMIPAALRRTFNTAEDADMLYPGRSARISAASSLSWDETQENLVVGFDKKLRPDQQAAAWQIMVSMAYICTSTVPYNENDEIVTDSMSVVCPPVVLSNTGAEAMWQGLHKVPARKQFEDACHHMDEHADIHTRSYTRDGASSNTRLLAFSMPSLLPRTLVSDKVCELHNCKIVQVATTTAVGGDVINLMYSMSLMFRSSTQYFLRLLYAVEPYVRATLDVRQGPPPADARPYAELVADHIAGIMGSAPSSDTSLRKDKTCYYGNDFARHGASPMRTGILHWMWKLLSLLNGQWWKDTGKLVHYTDYIITPSLIGNLVDKITEAIRNTILHAMPTIPKTNKWVQLTMCVNWVLLSVMPHNLMKGVYEMAFHELTVKIEKQAAAFEEAVGIHEVFEEANFSKVAGARMKKGRELYHTDENLVSVIVMAIVLEGLHYFTKWLIIRGASNQDARVPPPLLDLVSLVYSPVVVMRQYFSSLFVA